MGRIKKTMLPKHEATLVSLLIPNHFLSTVAKNSYVVSVAKGIHHNRDQSPSILVTNTLKDVS